MITVSEKSLYDLEWDRIVDFLAGYAATLRGRGACLSLETYDIQAEAEFEIERVREYQGLLEQEDAPSLAGVSSEVAELVVQTQKQGVLSVPELVQVMRTIEASNRISQHLAHRAQTAPQLAELGAGLTELTASLDAIRYAVDPGTGELLDRASSELGGLRKRMRDLNGKVKRKLDSMLDSEQYKPLLRDTYYTVRDDRYVLPVKAQHKSTVKGIVHGSSGSGQTLFIEPREMVAVNNDLMLAQMEVEREERRILRDLSRAVADEGRIVLANMDTLTRLDVVQAKAAMAEVLDCLPPKLTTDTLLKLPDARHPLLLMKGTQVVSNDLYVGEDFRALILTGANTGGKTVALKTMGLLTMMAWCGMLIPAGPDAVVGRFEHIHAVMGDEQSLSDDLSTFSANILKLNSVVQSCNKRSLVLLDEIVVGTDPRQGAALAQAIVEGIADSGSCLVVTTHYERLKRLAYARSDCANAAVGLSDETLKPTYRITIGVPGVSAAFNIASELGVQAAIISRAQDLMKGENDELDEMVGRLQEELERQREEVRRLSEMKREVEIARETYKRKLRLLETREREEALARHKDVLEEIGQARETVREMIRTLQRGADMAQAGEAAKKLQEMEKQAQQNIEQERAAIERDRPKEEKAKQKKARKSLKSEHLIADTPVFIENLAQKGVVVEPPDKRGLVLVEVGRLKMRIPAERLQSLLPGEVAVTDRSKNKLRDALAAARQESASGPGGREERLTLDLRGERVEEALDRTESFLDLAYRSNSPFVYIIHGHGTGRLKAALRNYFRDSHYVKSYRPGERGEGQDGVTVVMLRDK